MFVSRLLVKLRGGFSVSEGNAILDAVMFDWHLSLFVSA